VSVSKPGEIELGDGSLIPIVYEDRGILAIDKPPGWMLAPSAWDRTGRNLQRALESSLRGGDFWARSRHLKYLRFIHRLDAETSGLMLLAKNVGVLKAFQTLFETRRVEKIYLAVVQGVPQTASWVCRWPLAPDPEQKGKMRIGEEAMSNREGYRRSRRPSRVHETKPAETRFHVLQSGPDSALVEARPVTGRTHQIRVHLAASGYAVLGDGLYGGKPAPFAKAREWPLALRAVGIHYRDPFTGASVRVAAPIERFVRAFGFDPHQVPACRQVPDCELA